MIFEYLASYCTNHFRHLLWKVSAVCALLTLLGKLFHMRHPEYLILCLKHSFLGSGGTKPFVCAIQPFPAVYYLYAEYDRYILVTGAEQVGFSLVTTIKSDILTTWLIYLHYRLTGVSKLLSLMSSYFHKNTC